MKKATKNEKLKFFCKVFAFITEYFGIAAKALCESASGWFSEASVSSWRTRFGPRSDEAFRELLFAMNTCLVKKYVLDYYDKNDYVEKVRKIISGYSKTPDFLRSETDYNIIELVVKTLEFAYLFKNLMPSPILQNVEIAVTSCAKHSNAKTEAVVFDFDGTLTTTNKVRTTWESIWTMLGYSVNDCVELHAKFSNHEITHAEWCSLTEEKFKARRLNRNQLSPLIESTQLITGIEEIFQELDQRDIKVYIVSGSIKYIIRKCLGNLVQYVSGGIDANIFDFDEEGYLTQIIGTAYDFEGKAARITNIAKELNIAPEQILFVGNSLNDEWAHTSGARTLAINPKNTNMYNKSIWDDCIVDCKSLVEIMKYI